MRKFIVAAALIGALATGAGVQADNAGVIYYQNGIMCKTASAGIVCARTNATGYGIGFSRSAVLVMRFDADGSSHSVFRRYQP